MWEPSHTQTISSKLCLLIYLLLMRRFPAALSFPIIMDWCLYHHTQRETQIKYTNLKYSHQWYICCKFIYRIFEAVSTVRISFWIFVWINMKELPEGYAKVTNFMKKHISYTQHHTFIMFSIICNLNKTIKTFTLSLYFQAGRILCLSVVW